jgi:hypothetical protein
MKKNGAMDTAEEQIGPNVILIYQTSHILGLVFSFSFCLHHPSTAARNVPALDQ